MEATTDMSGSTARDQIAALRERMGEAIIGQREVIERLLIGLLANGSRACLGLPRPGRSRFRERPAAFLHHFNPIRMMRPWTTVWVLSSHCRGYEPGRSLTS